LRAASRSPAIWLLLTQRAGAHRLDDRPMNDRHLRLSSATGAIHPAVLQRRIHDLLLIGLTGLIPAAIALGIIVEMPNATVANAVLVLAGIVAVLGIAAFVV